MLKIFEGIRLCQAPLPWCFQPVTKSGNSFRLEKNDPIPLAALKQTRRGVEIERRAIFAMGWVFGRADVGEEIYALDQFHREVPDLAVRE